MEDAPCTDCVLSGCHGDDECPCNYACHDDGNGTCDVCGSALDYMGICVVCPASLDGDSDHDPSLDVIDCDDGTCPADRG